jgi:transposase
MIETGTSIRETAAIFNIATHSTIIKWQKGFELHGIDALKPTKKGRAPVKKKTNKPQLKKHYELKMSVYGWRMLT